MYRKIQDFLEDWEEETRSTLRVFKNLTDASLEQRVSAEGRTLGRLAWHLALTLHEMPVRAGLDVLPQDEEAPPPAQVRKIAEAYLTAAESVASQVALTWTEEDLSEEVEIYGERWTKGKFLSVLILHQAHHRGQMTVLMRQAGLSVPGVCGPAREEWAAFGMPAMA